MCASVLDPPALRPMVCGPCAFLALHAFRIVVLHHTYSCHSFIVSFRSHLAFATATVVFFSPLLAFACAGHGAMCMLGCRLWRSARVHGVTCTSDSSKCTPKLLSARVRSLSDSARYASRSHVVAVPQRYGGLRGAPGLDGRRPSSPAALARNRPAAPRHGHWAFCAVADGCSLRHADPAS